MREDLIHLAADLARRREPFVQAVVVGREAPSSAQVGDRAVITAGGVFHGWLGGSCTRPTVLAEARRALADGRPRLVALSPDPPSERGPGRGGRSGVRVFPMTCHSGGSVEIYLEPILPSPSLAVFGASPAARALAKLGAALGYRVTAVDPDAAAEDFPGAERVVTGLPGPDLATAVGRRPFAVVATMGEGDKEAIRAALALEPAYLGVVASARRFARMRETLAAAGVTAAALDRVRSPAGLDLGARTPEEIALSILAEIVKVRRSGGAEEGIGPEAGAGVQGAAAGTPAAAPIEAIDPICGMTVQVAPARHTAEHAGATYYFCCGGCRERFLAEPERYTAPAGASETSGGAP